MTGIVLVCLAAFLWGTVGVANSLMTGGTAVDPAVVGLARTSLGAASLMLAAVMLRLPWPARRELPIVPIAVFGLAGAVFQTLLFAAFRHVGVTVTVAVTVCAPVVLVTIGDAAWRRRVPDRGVALAVAVASVGVLLALPQGVRPAGAEAAALDPLGISLLAGASVAFAIVAATARLLARRLHPLRAAGLGLGASAAALGVAVAIGEGAALPALARLPRADIAILAYTGIAATGCAYLAFVLGMHLSRSASAGLAATLIEPGVAALLAALVLREHLTINQLAGCSLMMGAMVLLFAAERRAPSG